MSSSDDERIAHAPVNYRRGMFFIRLAVEQVRAFDPKFAELIRSQYIDPLNRIFEKSLSRIPWETMDSRSRMHELSQQASGMVEWRKIRNLQDLPLGPPGFGLENQLGFKEVDGGVDLTAFEAAALTRQAQSVGSSFIDPWSTSSQLPATFGHFRGRPSSPATPSTEGDKRNGSFLTRTSTEPTQKVRDFGPIGPAKPSAILAARKAKEVAPTTDFSSISYDNDYPFGAPTDIFSFKGLGEGSSSRAPTYQQGKPSTYLEDALAAYISEHKDAANTARLARRDSDGGVNVFANRPRANASNSGYMSAGDSFHSVDTHKSSSQELDAEHSFRTPNVSSRGVEDTSTTAHISEASTAQPTPAPATSSWAKIAAIPKESATASATANGKSPHITLTLASPTARLPVGGTAIKTPKEPQAEQLRVVWLANLPRNYRSRDVSAHIVEGPVMSILLQIDAHETLPGLSACIIFMSAEHAAQYLAANNYSAEQGKQAGPTKYASDVVRAARADKPSGATDVTVIPGAPYPSDAALQLMGPPSHGRRRVKWSRARLFYDVSLRQFKRDVLALVGSPANVELFHFYNPGECTVVFSSVAVAAVVVDGFNALRKERKPPGVAAVTTLEEEGRAGGIGEGRLDGKVGRYEGVEVGFVRDFNEAPPGALWSQYGRDGRLRASSRDEGCEGIFEGPDVAA